MPGTSPGDDEATQENARISPHESTRSPRPWLNSTTTSNRSRCRTVRGWSAFCVIALGGRARLHRAGLSGAAGAVEPLRAPEGPRRPADGDAHRAGHSRRSHQCRADRRRKGRALRHAGRRLVSRRSRDAEILDRDRRQRAARPALSRRAGQPAVLSRPPRGSRLRKARRQQRRSPPPCAVLEGAGPGPGEAAGLARRGDLRPQRRRQPLYRRHHPSYRCRYRRRARSCSPPTWKPPAWSMRNIRSRASD